MIWTRAAFLACFVVITVAANLRSAQVSLPASADTSLFAAFPDNNLGASPSLVSGVNGSGYPARELIRFDLAGQIPSNAVIQSAVLNVNVIMTPAGGGVAATFDLHRMLVDWIEGTGASNSGSAANDGEPTWNNRASPDTPWSAPGGAVPVDFSSNVGSTAFLTNTGPYTFDSTSNLVSDVRQWLANPATNFGWMIVCEAETTPFTAKRIGSREDIGSEPSLLVQYTLPGDAPVLGITAGGFGVNLSYLAPAGQSSVVQYRDSLDSGVWLTLTNLPAPATATNVIVPDSSANQAHRFYRVLIPQ